MTITENEVTLESVEQLKNGDDIMLGELGSMTVIEPRFGVLRKGGRIIQRSLLVRLWSERSERLLMVSADQGM